MINKIEQYWHKNEVFPPNDFFKYEEFDIAENLKHETFHLALVKRGITIPVVTDRNVLAKPDGLTAEQVAAITTVINFEDKRPRSVKLREMGISATQWGGWLKEPEFKSFLHQMTTTHLNDVLHIANEGLLHAVERGDTNAIKFYYELTGRHTQESGSMQNLKVVVAKLIESVQRNVKDPEILRAISTDFEIILSGGNPILPARQIEGVI
jgi:hypothetical protein